ncbi:MAG: MFS transporter [Eubacteriales bacterium]
MSNPKQNRVLPLIAAISIQLCLGVAYIWSVFQTGIANSLFGGDNASASLTYSLLLAILTIGSVIGGKLTTVIPLKKVVMFGGFILSIGFFLASFTKPEFSWLIWICYGGLGGLGMGFAYSTTIACVQKWYPDKKGLVTGMIVAALGLGGVVFTPLVEYMIVRFGGQGAGELMTLRVISFIFLVVCTVGSLFLNMPKEEQSTIKTATQTVEYTPSQVLKQPVFYLVAFSMMLACMGGLMMIGFAKPIAIARGMVETATIGVLSISVFNSFGRLFWGFISDKLGRLNTLAILMLGTSVMALLVNVATGYWIFVLIGCIGFFYGGLLSNFPPLTAELFGSKNVATNYGMVLLGFGLAAVISSYIAGYFKNLAANDINLMFPAFAIASACSAAGIVMVLLLKKIKPKKA